jgi:hypothetical protein
VAAPPGRVSSVVDKMHKTAEAAMSRKRKGLKRVKRVARRRQRLVSAS